MKFLPGGNSGIERTVREMLDNFFKPEAVALIGASSTPGKVGFDILKNITDAGFYGKLYPVNPKADEIFGMKCYNNVDDIDDRIDLAVIMIPPKFIPGTLEQLAGKGCDSAIIISAGFKEIGPEGARLEREMLETAKKQGIRLLGPNCLGVIDTDAHLNATFAAGMPSDGNIGFVSQSGALCTAILDWSFANSIGFSRFISLGNKADIDEVDMIAALGEDERTSVIVGYVEGVSRGREFMDTLLEVTKKKPVILIKSGTSEAGARAASSHTGSMAGSDVAFDAAFRQCGVMRARTVEEIFDYAVAFSFQNLPRGNKLAVLTNAGGPGIMATDALDDTCAEMARFSPDTIEKLKGFLPAAAAFYNPVDVVGDARADRYQDAMMTLLDDEGVDGIVILLTPQGMTQIEETAKAISYASLLHRKPILAAFMGEEMVASGINLLGRSHIPNYSFPERAVGAFGRMVEYEAWRKKPAPKKIQVDYPRAEVEKLVKEFTAHGKGDVSGERALQLMKAAGIKVPEYRIAEDMGSAKEQSAQFGYPVVLKVASPDISHKSDVGGVKVGIKDEEDLERAYNQIMVNCRKAVPNAIIHGVEVHEMVVGGKELVLGMNRDPSFGPLIMFGLGGIYVEIIKDVNFRVAPLTGEDVDSLVAEMKSAPLLTGARGETPKDVEGVKETIRIISQLTVDFENMIEMDINPLIALDRGQGVYAVDARFNFQVPE